jgi:hypothetical protein
MVFTYDPANIPHGFTASQLEVVFYNGSAWVEAASQNQDSVDYVFTVVSNHFSPWGIVGNQNSFSPVPTGQASITVVPTSTFTATYTPTIPILINTPTNTSTSTFVNTPSNTPITPPPTNTPGGPTYTSTFPPTSTFTSFPTIPPTLTNTATIALPSSTPTNTFTPNLTPSVPITVSGTVYYSLMEVNSAQAIWVFLEPVGGGQQAEQKVISNGGSFTLVSPTGSYNLLAVDDYIGFFDNGGNLPSEDQYNFYQGTLPLSLTPICTPPPTPLITGSVSGIAMTVNGNYPSCLVGSQPLITPSPTATFTFTITPTFTPTLTSTPTPYWATVGSAGFSSTDATGTWLAIYDGEPYVAFSDVNSGGNASVMFFFGSTWSYLGATSFSGLIGNPSLAFNGSIPYVAYQDVNNGNRATVMEYISGGWTPLGSADFSAGAILNPVLAVSGSGTPYVAFEDQTVGNLTVMSYNGTSWGIVGTAGIAAGAAYNPSLGVYNGTPYVAYDDYINGGNATVLTFNGTNWVPVGSAGFTSGSTDGNLSLAINSGGIPYVAYHDAANGGKATVMTYNGSGWAIVGSAGFSPGGAVITPSSLAISAGGVPYVVFEDQADNDMATVMNFIGGSWVNVGNPDFSAGKAYDPSLALNGNTPYVAYEDNANGDKATVMVLQ